MSCALTSKDIWWTRIFDRLNEFLHNYPKLPKSSLSESSKIGSKVTIENYNTFLDHYGSRGYKFQFQLNSDNRTGEVFIIGMATAVHAGIVSRLQKFFEVPNNGVVDDPPIIVTGQPFHYVPGGNGIKGAAYVTVRPDVALVPRPAISTVIPHPPADTDGNPHARIMCEIAVGPNVGDLKRKCESWMREQYVRAVVSIKISEPRQGVREPGTGYFFRTMTAKLYRQGMPKQRWDFGNVRKHAKDPINNMNDSALCNVPNDPRFQINIPISDVFWDPPFPIPNNYIPVILTNVIENVFSIDLYRIQRVALKSRT
ncbi:hypothetical protein RclHR1_09430006 [Rhizophagus clarus]|uniref:Uncharacterized protein n=1 Tax=Rhizophagus clarus TaxID=94130 RepID=A0A2Z6SEP1_9GLOM|nr:hypothetical protein RclHR1_09430006 [Rhizophagus clarus]GES82618.1 hypothetical protein GLOIN_2v1734790 [Rhizophagus clarus]